MPSSNSFDTRVEGRVLTHVLTRVFKVATKLKGISHYNSFKLYVPFDVLQWTTLWMEQFECHT